MKTINKKNNFVWRFHLLAFQWVCIGWKGKFLSLLSAIAIYMYYQSAIQAEVSFVLPLQIEDQTQQKVDGQSEEQKTLVNLLDTREISLYLSGRAQDLENLRSSDFAVYVKVDAEQEGVRNLPVEYRMRNNAQLKRGMSVKIRPSFVALAVEREVKKKLPVEVSINGYPATGYSLGTYRVYPGEVGVAGPASFVEGLEFISTISVDITGRNESFKSLVDLKPPALKNLRLDVSRVQVEIQIDARSKTQTFALVPEITNLPGNLRLIEMLPERVQLTLQGSIDALQKIEAGEQQISVELDGGDIFASGRYALPVVVGDLPEGLSLIIGTPNRVSVVLGEY